MTAQADQPLGVLVRFPLTGVLEGHEMVLSRSAMRFFPGTSTPAHRHPGIVLAYVLEGRVRLAISSGAEQLIPAGGRSSSRSARCIRRQDRRAPTRPLAFSSLR
jgi:quercetin dioxygenase-like cupin family protein